MNYFFEKKSRRYSSIAVLLLVCVVFTIYKFVTPATELTDIEADAITDICGINAAIFDNISNQALTKEITDKFPAVVKAYSLDKLYAFIVKPVAYNGPISLAVVIDGEIGETLGMRIVDHLETRHYVRDMESSWFIERFASKPVNEYLKLVRLKALNRNEIVAITGATVTTEAVLNGVNAAFGVYREYVLKEQADDVPYMVRFEPGQGDGPVETGKLAIRAYGVVLAEVTLEEIKELPSVRRTLSIHSSEGTTSHNFRGTLLSSVLEYADQNFTIDYDRALAVGVDDYISDIRMDEIKAENNVFIMYEDNDEPLLKKNGEQGAMRIIVINDTFGQRFTNYLLEIVLESALAP